MAKVLIVDDSKLIRNIIKDELQKKGHTIIAEASDGKEGLEAYKQHSPDLVTMDITMDEMDGIEAIKQIMKVDKTAKIIVVSALGQDELINTAIDLGVVDFIIKPFEPERLISSVNKAI
ncbi:MAG: response regulator [Spirochaetales bacterium]|nr:response regulator [Spirochaetales bacterium]